MSSESEDGYRDLTICVLFTTSCGMRMIGEIQVHDRKIHQLKLEVLNPARRTGILFRPSFCSFSSPFLLQMHKLYRILRAESLRDI